MGREGEGDGRGSAVDFAEHDVDAAKNGDGVGDGVPEAQVLEDREVDEGRRAHPVAVGIRAAVADQGKIRSRALLGPSIRP